MEVTEVVRKQSRTIQNFEQVLAAAIKKHQTLEIQAGRDGYYTTETIENQIVTALIKVRNGCGG